MFRFLFPIAITFAFLLPSAAKAECNPSQVWIDFEVEYNHWLDHRKKKMHRHKGKRSHCGGKRHHRRGHHRPPPPLELPSFCIVCPQVAKPTHFDEGFCPIPKGEFRSDKFLIGDQKHILTILIVNKELVIDLVWLNNERNVSDDGKYIAFPEGFAKPAKPTQIPITQFPDKAQVESQKYTCNNTRALNWDTQSGQVLPNFFAGKINMVYTQDVIYTEASFTTAFSTTAFIPIQLKRVPDKKIADTP